MLNKVRYFQAVVKNMSFTDAAYECNISQSAISQQVKALEQELGFLLLERKNRKISLTPAGEYFYNKSLVLLADCKRICMESAKIANGSSVTLRVGYLRGYRGSELKKTLDEFALKYPDVELDMKAGNHEELYEMLRSEKVDIVLNDQRRAFSDEYVNLVLAAADCYIEISARSPLAKLKSVTPQSLKNTPCILVASSSQQETEKEYYRDIAGFNGEFLFAENLDEARFMIVGGKGFMPIEGVEDEKNADASICKVPLFRGDEQMRRNYCAFWKKDNSGYYVEEFAEILKSHYKP